MGVSEVASLDSHKLGAEANYALWSDNPSDRPCRYCSGINSATFLVLLTNSGSSRLSNCSSVSRTRGLLSCIDPRTLRKPPGSAVCVPIAGL